MPRCGRTILGANTAQSTLSFGPGHSFVQLVALVTLVSPIKPHVLTEVMFALVQHLSVSEGLSCAPQVFSLVASSLLRLQVYTTIPTVMSNLSGAEVSNPGSHACLTVTLPTEPCLQALRRYVKLASCASLFCESTISLSMLHVWLGDTFTTYLLGMRYICLQSHLNL